MMRVIFIFLVMLGLAISTMAQGQKQEDPNLLIRTTAAEGATPEEPKVLGTRFDPKGVGELLESGVQTSTKESTVKTNEMTHSKVSFLMSTGIEYEDEGDWKEAEQVYLRALEHDPTDDNLLFRLSGLYVSMARYGEAIELLERQVERYPENPMLHNNLSWCYSVSVQDRNVSKALLHAREALISWPDNPSVWNTLAEAYYVAGDYEHALRSSDYSLELLMKMEPEEREVQSYLNQRAKIARAFDAFKMLEGIEDED